MDIKRVGDIEIEEDAAYQRRFHKAQRVSWALMSLAVLLALAGLAGPGLSGTDESESPDRAVKTEYNGTVFHQKDSEMTIKVKTSEGGRLSVWISRDYLESVYMKQMLPRPEEVIAAEGKIYFGFRLDGSARELEISLYFQPLRVGRLSGSIGSGKSTVEFSQFVFP
ncbi:hypothetical protein BAC1_00539 [uncultured bacterium]|nr:hypothetical protein BAC1_00539 [uncultured bacterium]